MARVLRGLALTVAGFVVFVVIALGFYSRTDHFLNWLEKYVLAALNGSSRGRIIWAGVDGSIWSRIGIDNLQVHHQGRAIFTAQRVELEISLLPLLWRHVQITRLSGSQPMLDMRLLADGDWNIVQALTSGEPSSGPSQWTIAIDGIALRGGELALRPTADGNDLYRLRQLDVAGRVSIAGELAIHVNRLASWAETPQTPPLYARGGMIYRQTEHAQSLALEKLSLQTAQSRVTLAGAIEDFTRWQGDLRLDIPRLAAADIVRYAAQWPAGIDVAGTATVRGPASAVAGVFDLQLAGARVSGSAGADLLAERKTYQGVLAIQKLSLERFFADQEIAGVVNAEVKLAGAGFELETLSGSGVAQLHGLVFRERGFGAASVQADWRGGAVKFSVEVGGPLGSGSGRGELRWAAMPAYQGELSLRNVNAGALLQLPDAGAGRFSFDARVSGAGFDLATANSRAEVDVLPSQWNQARIQSGKLLARVEDGRLHLDELRLQAPGANLTAAGMLGIAAPQTGQVNYRLQVNDLAPWLKLLDRQGSGQLLLNGRAEGSLAQLQANGVMELRQVKLAEGSAAGARIDFALMRRSDAALPQGSVKLEANGVAAGAIAGARLSATIALPAAPARALVVRAEGRDAAGRALRLVAEIEDQPAQLVVRARELVVTVGGNGWTMTRPATITRRGDDFLIDRLELRHGGAQALAAGRFALTGSQSFSVAVTGIQPGLLRAILPQAAQSSGVLSAQAQVSGSAAAPQIVAAAELGAGQIAGQNYQAMRARADYRQQRLGLDLLVEQDSAHRLQIGGTIPMTLGWEPSPRFEMLPGMELRVRSAGLSLAFLNALKLPLQNISGQVALDMLIVGRLSEPQARGSFQLLDSAFTVPELGIRVTDVGISGNADRRRLQLSRIEARSAGGTLSGSGVVALRQWMPLEIALNLTARRWPAIATERYRARVDAELRVSGPLTAPAIGGKVRLVEGTVRPSLDLLERSPVDLQRDPTIVVVQRRGGPPLVPRTNGKVQNGVDNPFWRGLSLAVTLAVPNNLWIRHPNANIELSGNLEIGKAAEQEVTLTGLVETVRGWVGFQGRRFEISRGRAQFAGAQPIDPAIQVIAEYQINDYRVSAIAGGTASKPTLELASQPRLEQSDILSLLLFGRPIGELSGGEQLSLQKSAIDIGAGFAAAQLGKAVSGALGLDALGIDLSDLTFAGGQVRFGRYLGSQTYFSVSQDIAGGNGREVSLEYRLTPNLRVEANTGSAGNSGVDIIWRKRY